MTRHTVAWRYNLRLSGVVCGAYVATMLWLTHPVIPPQLLQFVAEHGNIAAAILRGDGFADPFGTPSGPTAWTPPVFPCYVAIIFFIFGTKTLASAWVLLFLDCVLAATCVLCTSAILDLSSKPALKPWFAGTLVALTWLHEAALGPWLSTGWFVAALNAAFLMAASGVYTTGRKRWWGLLAISGSLLVLTYAGCGLACMVVVFLLWPMMARKAKSEGRVPSPHSWRLALARPAIVLVVLAIPLGAWTLRNWIQFDRLIPLKSAGWFEVYLAEKYTSDGVLDDAAMLAHHPFANPRLLVDYTVEGEATFLSSYGGKARALLAASPRDFVRHVGNRALSIFSYCETAPHAYWCRANLTHDDAAKLVSADLAARFTTPMPVMWTSLQLTPQEFEATLQHSGVTEAGPIVRDWLNAKATRLDNEAQPIRIFSGIALAGLPAACLLGTLVLRLRKPDHIFNICACFYLVALLPHVLITHYGAYPLHFLGLHAFFIVSFGSSLFRRHWTRPNEFDEGLRTS
jgi:hypothetical protein